MSICFHVDDCKLSHRDPIVMVGRVFEKSNECVFEDGSSQMTVSRGKVHKCLGMTLDYEVRGQVKISMFVYVDEILAGFDKAELRSSGTKTSATPEDR
jgi:hypothetical protein